MHIKELRFVSANQAKNAEVQEMLGMHGIKVVPIAMKIVELQTEDAKLLVKHKALQAFKRIYQPLIVEHTGLFLNSLNGLPGGLTQIFWDRLQADRFSELFGNTPDTGVLARTTIGYVDGRKVHLFEGEAQGRIASKPAGNRDFQWDCIFIPDKYSQTYAELGTKKNEISMRRMALERLASFLKKGVI